jgi:hypothetical protein
VKGRRAPKEPRRSRSSVTTTIARLQDEFEGRRIAGRSGREEKLTRTAFNEDDGAFIESVPYFDQLNSSDLMMIGTTFVTAMTLPMST